MFGRNISKRWKLEESENVVGSNLHSQNLSHRLYYNASLRKGEGRGLSDGNY